MKKLLRAGESGQETREADDAETATGNTKKV